MNTIKIHLGYGLPLSYILLFMVQGIVSSLLLLLLFIIFTDVSLRILASSLYFIFIFYLLYDFNTRFFKLRYRVIEEMIELSNLKGKEQILDIGTGSGFLAIGFATKIKEDGKVTGIDKYNRNSNSIIPKIAERIKINFVGYSIDQAEKNRKKEQIIGTCDFLQVDITQPLPFPDEQFDIILSSQSLYCLPRSKLRRTLNEIDRVLKKGGTLIFFESRGFLQWNIQDIKDFYIKRTYSTELIHKDYMRNNCLFHGIKQK